MNGRMMFRRPARTVVVPLAAALAITRVLGACSSSDEAPAFGESAVVDSSPPVSPQTSDSAPSSRDTLVANRTPATDPWLFEGIPNFEDLVGSREGDWVVVLGTATRFGAAPAPTIMASSDADLAAAQQRAWNAGRVPFVVGSELLPAFEAGLTVVVLGPMAQVVAERELAALRSVFADAYVRKAW